jgi:fluoroquinolone resistance protein
VHLEMSDLSSTVFSHADYADQTFREVHVEHGEIVSSEFYDCVFVRCSFVESVFRKCGFVNCAFRECDLSLVQVPESRFSSSRFENTKVIGVNWTEADWATTGLGDPMGFLKCAISHSTFIALRLKGIQIRDCVAVDVDFREADLAQADFGGTDLSKSMFGKTDLSEADLSRARNYSIDPGRNVLKGAKFSLPEAMSLLHSMDIVLVEES